MAGASGYGSARPDAGRAATASGVRPRAEDDRALARYRYLLRTAPPEQLEALHAEAFATLTPEQRQQLLRELSAAAPQEAGASTEPADLARAATRAEMRRPGVLESTFSRGSFGGAGGMGMGGMGMGGMVAGSMMGTIAGVVVGSAIADMMLGGYDQSPEAQEAGDSGDTGTDAGGDGGDAAGGDTGGDGEGTGEDVGLGDSSGGDWAGGDDFGGGGFGGADLGGGGFGGGDFGGGDFGGF